MLTVWQTYIKAIMKKATGEIGTHLKKIPDRMPVQIMISIVPEGYEGKTSMIFKRSYTVSKEVFNDTVSQSKSSDR